MDEEAARWVRVEAAKRDMSVSRFVAKILRESMQDSLAYQRAMRKNLARKPQPISSGPYPTRDELHDRPGLRR